MSTETTEEWAARVAPTLDWEAFHRVFEDEGEAPREDIEAMERAGLLHIEHGVETATGGTCWGSSHELVQAMIDHRNMVAKGLTIAQRNTLRHLDHTRYQTSRALLDRGLIAHQPRYMDGFKVELTSFGREVARLLEADHG